MITGLDIVKTDSRRNRMSGKFRIVNSIEQSGLTTSLSLIEKFADKGKMAVYFNGTGHSRITTMRSEEEIIVYKNTVAEWIESLTMTYGNDWDFIWTTTNNGFLLTPVIRFKKINLVSEEGGDHDLKELVVGFDMVVSSFSSDEPYFVYQPQNISGMRLNLNTDEISSNYVHSHLNNMQGMEHVFYNFCLGHNEVNDLAMQLGSQHDNGLFCLFLLTIKSMIQWESITGVPYRRIKKIGESTTSNQVSYSSHGSHFENFMNSYKERIFSCGLFKFYMAAGRVKIKESPEFVAYLKDFLLDNGLEKYIAKQVDGAYGPKWIKYNPGTDRSRHGAVGASNRYIFFRGEKIYKTTTSSRNNNNEQQNNIDSYTVYPKFLKDVIYQAENFLHKRRIEKHFIGA